METLMLFKIFLFLGIFFFAFWMIKMCFIGVCLILGIKKFQAKGITVSFTQEETLSDVEIIDEYLKK